MLRTTVTHTGKHSEWNLRCIKLIQERRRIPTRSKTGKITEESCAGNIRHSGISELDWLDRFEKLNVEILIKWLGRKSNQYSSLNLCHTTNSSPQPRTSVKGTSQYKNKQNLDQHCKSAGYLCTHKFGRVTATESTHRVGMKEMPSLRLLTGKGSYPTPWPGDPNGRSRDPAFQKLGASKERDLQ